MPFGTLPSATSYMLGTFYKHFINKKRIDIEFGKFYSKLFGKRHKGDYQVLQYFDRETIETLIDQTKKFVDKIEKLINVRHVLPPIEIIGDDVFTFPNSILFEN